MIITRTKFELFMNIETAGGGIFSPKGNEFVFVYDAPGTFQVYSKSLAADAWPQRVSFSENRCTNPRYLPTGEILFTTDDKGNENFQLRVFSNDLLEKQITSDLKAKHMLGFIGNDKLFYSANVENKQRFDIYYLDIPLKEDGKAVKIIEGIPGTIMIPVTMDSEGNRLAVQCYRSNVDADIFIYDFETKELSNITEEVKKGDSVRFYPEAFLPNGVDLIVRTDLMSEFIRLAVLNIETKELTWLTDDLWDVEEVVYKNNHLVFAKNVDGYSEIFTINDFQDKNSDFNPDKIDLPIKGVLASGDLRSYTQAMSLDEKGERLLFSWTAGNIPLNVWLYDFNKKAAKQVTFSSTAGIPLDSFVAPELHRFKSFDGLEVPYFFYPAKQSSQAPAPCILLIHGGPEAQIRPTFSKVIQFFLSEGFAVVTPNIRGSSGYGKTYMSLDDKEKRLDSIRDIKELAEHLKKNEKRIDPNKLAVYGGSYGGFAVLASITEYPDLFNAAIDIVGISNFVTFLKNTAAWRRKLREAEYGSLEDDYDMLVRISPIHKVDRIKTPLLIIQGDNDERVPLSEAIQIYEALEKRGVPVELLRFEDEGHGIVKRKNQIIAYKKIVDFLKQHLK